MEFFQRGQSIVLVQNLPFFHVSFLGNIGQGNVFYDILERINAFLGYKNKKFKKIEKMAFFQRGQSMVLVQKWSFFHFFFFSGIIGQGNVFYDILQQKNAFLSYKNKKFKQSKKWHFSKGVSPWFWSKISHFFTFLFKAMQGREMCFNDILERKNAFLGFKYKKFKKSKKWHFSKGVSPWFWSKISHFSTFLFLAIWGRKICFIIFQNKKTPFQAIKTRSSKSRKIHIFPKGLVHGFRPKFAIFSPFFLKQYKVGKCVL